jgi:hypothetical protein
MKDEAFEAWTKEPAQAGYFSLIRDESSGNYQGATLQAYYGWRGAMELMKRQEACEAAQPDPILQEIFHAQDRLAWIIENKALRVQGTDERGWSIMDCSDGLTFLVRHAKTYEEAIDEGMKKRPLKEVVGALPRCRVPLI